MALLSKLNWLFSGNENIIMNVFNGFNDKNWPVQPLIYEMFQNAKNLYLLKSDDFKMLENDVNYK